MSTGSNLVVVGVVTWSLGGYLTGSFDVFHVTTWLFIKNVHLFCYHWNYVSAEVVSLYDI